MSLLQKIKADQLEARKSRHQVRAELLTTLYAEAAKKGKDAGNRESTDEEVRATIKAFLKSNTYSQEQNPPNLNVLHEEEAILTEYMPAMLSFEEVEKMVEDLITSGKKDMGSIMKSLKETHAGLYDGAMASKIIRMKLG